MDSWIDALIYKSRRESRFAGRACLLLVITFLVALCSGCHKSAAPPSAFNSSNSASNPAPAMDTIVRIHWLGKKKIAADTNSAQLMSIWNMPESVNLESQVLEKLAQAPWRLLRDETNKLATNLLGPVLRDLVNEESYAEVRQPANSTNASEEMILAVRMSDYQAGVWDAGVAMALQSLTGIKPVPAGHGWSLKKHHAPNLIEMVRAGEWTVLGAAEDHNSLLDEVLARIQREHMPFAAPTSNSWLQADLDLPRLAGILEKSNNFAAKIPEISLAAFGKDGLVNTAGGLVFSPDEFSKLDAWSIPTNLLQPNLTSFSAIRGVAPLLELSRKWRTLNLGSPPDQFYVWSLSDFAMETYFAAPSPAASNVVSHLTDLILQKSQKWRLTNDVVKFRKARNNGLEWGGLPYVMPFLQFTNAAATNFIFGGSFQPETLYPASRELFSKIYQETNLIYYDWERTGERIDQLIYLSQFVRLAADRPQFAKSSPGLVWLKALVPKLGQSTTYCEMADIPGHVTFYRKSTIGFTALELHLLVTWMESGDAADAAKEDKQSAPAHVKQLNVPPKQVPTPTEKAIAH